MNSDAFRFLQEAAAKPDWAKRIRDGKPDEIVSLARDNGYDCDLDELKKVASEIVHGSGKPDEVTEHEIEEAEAGAAGFDKKGGYGADSGFALVSGIAAEVLRKVA